MNEKIEDNVAFGSLPIGAKFHDFYYSGDICIKVSEDTARAIGNPFVYCIAGKSIVKTVSNEQT